DDLGDGLYGCKGYQVPRQRLQLGLGPGCAPTSNDRRNATFIGARIEALFHRIDLGVIHQLWLAEDRARLLPELVGVCAKEHISVAAWVLSVRPHKGMIVAQRLRDRLLYRVIDH